MLKKSDSASSVSATWASVIDALSEAQVAETLKTGLATYWSRSRQELWTKGLSSGNVQKVKDMYLDCDGDTILLKVEQVGGAACHTGYRSCFFRRRQGDDWQTQGTKVFEPDEVYQDKK